MYFAICNAPKELYISIFMPKILVFLDYKYLNFQVTFVTHLNCNLNVSIVTNAKVKFLSKNPILTTPNIFTSFSPNFVLTIFLVKSKLSAAKKSKTTTISRVFHPKRLTIFSGNQSWFFGQKMKISNSVLEFEFSRTNWSKIRIFNRRFFGRNLDFWHENWNISHILGSKIHTILRILAQKFK